MFFFSIITHKGRTNDVVASVGSIRLCTDLGTHTERTSVELHPYPSSWRKTARWALNLSIFHFIIRHESKGNKAHSAKYFCGVNVCLENPKNQTNWIFSSLVDVLAMKRERLKRSTDKSLIAKQELLRKFVHVAILKLPTEWWHLGTNA